MTDALETHATHRPHVVVHPVIDGTRPFRRVDVLGTQVGKAYNLVDVVEFVRRAGLEDINLDDPNNVQWQDGGLETWTVD